MLKLEQVTCGYQTKKNARIVLENISMSIQPGQSLCLLGSNGAGKTTIFKTILGMIPAIHGTITLDEKPITEFSRAELARRIAYVPQQHIPPFPYTVMQVVLMGRCAHLQMYRSPGKEDVALAKEILERLGISHLEDRNYAELSGGERQLVLIARALAQQSEYLLLDEPVSNLDYGNQVRVIKHLKELRTQGIGVGIILHNPEHAFWLEGDCLVLQGKQVRAEGESATVLTPDLIWQIYGVQTLRKDWNTDSGKSAVSIVPELL